MAVNINCCCCCTNRCCSNMNSAVKEHRRRKYYLLLFIVVFFLISGNYLHVQTTLVLSIIKTMNYLTIRQRGRVVYELIVNEGAARVDYLFRDNEAELSNCFSIHSYPILPKIQIVRDIGKIALKITVKAL